MPLPESLQKIADRIIDFHDRQSTPPFLVYVYNPKDEYIVRRELDDLRRWLEVEPRSITCEMISLAEIFWDALEDHGHLELVIEAEYAGDYAEAQLAVNQILANPPTLAERITQRVIDYRGERSAVFLYRAGALYPAHRTGPLLDALRDQVNRPITMLYPGTILGDYGLKFMGKTEPAYGYRAFIIPRGDLS